MGNERTKFPFDDPTYFDRTDRQYHAWCRARALEIAVKRLEGIAGTDVVLHVADVFFAYIDEGRTP